MSGSFHVEFVVDKVARDRFLSEFFGFSCQYHSTVAPCSYITWGVMVTHFRDMVSSHRHEQRS
jgi:hypothetical protein